MRRYVLLPSLCFAALTCVAQPSVDEVLRRVAENQERAVAARKNIVYQQDTWVRLLRTNGKLSREEKRKYTVAPTETGQSKNLDAFEGRYEKGGKILTYDRPNFQHKDTDIDGELIEDLTSDLINDKKSKDGLSHDLFPLTKDEQRHYVFTLAGTRRVGQVDALVLKFEPNKEDHGEDDRPWAGEALVHPTEFQPVSVTTRLSFKIPMAVKIMFGIDIKQLGFNVTYAKVGDELWFPATYGTEFGLKVLFGYKRNITMNVTNKDFRTASADSKIQFETASVNEQ